MLISGVKLNNGQPPLGVVQIRDGATVLATVPVSPAGNTGYAIAYYRPITIPEGKHTYTATFVATDNANIKQSVSNPVRINR